MSSEKGSRIVEFEPEFKRVHAPTFCMYCGVQKPSDLAPFDFFAWRCDDCGHAVCVQCKDDMKAVGKDVECCWWNCPGNKQIKVRVKSQFEKPVMPKPYESFEGKIVSADRWYVEINVEGEWMPIDVINIQTNASQDMIPMPGKTVYSSAEYMIGRQEVRASFEIPMDDKNFEYLVKGTLIRASINVGGKLRTMFQGFIHQTPTFSVASQGITMVQVEAIEGEVIEPPQERHYIDTDALINNFRRDNMID